MKWLLVEVVLLVVFAIVAFVTGLEIGHRMGYDTAWVECRFDAKQQIGFTGNKAFWDWHDSNKPVIRKRRSLFQ